MSTESNALKSIGMPFPLLVNPSRMPLMTRSAIFPRMLGFDGAPKLVVVKLLKDVTGQRANRLHNRHLPCRSAQPLITSHLSPITSHVFWAATESALFPLV